MKISINKQNFKFYLWVGLAYLVLWLLMELKSYPDTFLVRAINTGWRTIYIIIINFIFFEYTLQFIKLTRKKILFSLLAVLAQVFLCSYGLYTWRNLGIQLHIHTSLKIYPSLNEALSEQTSIGVFSLFFFGILKHIYDYRKLKEAAQQLRIEKQEAELNYLKSQTNPHFLFNTLNNIYSLARDKSNLAPESILRLSKILRFMLYETGGTHIFIEQELKIISDYIALEKLRYDETLQVDFNFEIDDPKQLLPPLLLIPLVQNAFKHGVSETRTQPFIDIHLLSNQRQLQFTVKNSTDNSSHERLVKENIGLSNLRRQLELLYTDYNLSVQQGDDIFTVILKINLASHV